MKITISLKEKHLEDLLKQNKLLKEVIESFGEYKSCSIQICTQDYAVDCEQKRKDIFIRFIGDDE
jgi:hypothetical protein